MKLMIPAIIASILCLCCHRAVSAQSVYPYDGGYVAQASCDDCGGAAGACGCGGQGNFGGAGLAGGGLGSLLTGGPLGSGGWFEVEYLMWWSKERYVPALATTSDSGTAQNLAGVLGVGTTSILYGDQLIGDDLQSGYRTSTGRWIDAERTLGLGFRYFRVGGEEDGFSRSSDGDPILARPFFNTALPGEDSYQLAYPGESSGNLNIVAENEARGFDVYFRKLLLAGNCNRLDFIAGYHNSTVEDKVNIRDSLTALSSARVPVGTRIATHDSFQVENAFNGGFLGLMGEAADGPLTWRLLTKIAYGNMNQEASVSGTTTTTAPGGGATSVDNFGLLALGSNIGRIDQDESAIVPELNVSVAYNISSNFQLLLGYTFIYWSDVALAGDGIDTTINPTQIAGPLVGESRPTYTLVNDDFWYQGISVGGSIRY